MWKNRWTCCAKFSISSENPVKQKTVKHCKIHSSNREIWKLKRKVVIMLPKTKNLQKTRANLAIYCFSVNTYTPIRKKESKLRKMAALSQCLQKINGFWIYCQNPWKATVKELVHLSSNVFCTFNLTFFWQFCKTGKASAHFQNSCKPWQSLIFVN